MGLFRRPTPADSAEVERLRTELASLREALDDHNRAARTLDDRLTSLDDRVTSVSTELANQLSELGNDIDALNSRPPGTPLDEATVDELRDTQTRLASEQARYQIAFREDLARLAEQLRRPADPRRRT